MCVTRIWDGALYLNGWRKSGHLSDVTDKATGAVLAQTAHGGAQDITEACRLANMGASSWARTPVEQRAAIVRRAGELLEEFKEEAIYWLVRESGSTRYKADFEVSMAKAHFSILLK